VKQSGALRDSGRLRPSASTFPYGSREFTILDILECASVGEGEAKWSPPANGKAEPSRVPQPLRISSLEITFICSPFEALRKLNSSGVSPGSECVAHASHGS